ncbi:PfkB family carbohydrate kinase [Chachezhania antarctica]|uniref:PfkB family carbohydrate kinase n=1 Tax=Chachezhania antarctica TaxID=2340860 RepID=UPI000EB2792A|nr:PfkB family carbohydrate kinase [Chachezhania antarctica]
MTGTGPRAAVLCIGAVHWDCIATARETPGPGADLPGRIVRRPGGVAYNVARALTDRGVKAHLLAVLGDDAPGRELHAACAAGGLGTDGLIHLPDQPTDSYLAIEGPEGLVAAIADTATLDAGGSALRDALGAFETPWTGPVVIDANLSEPVLADLLSSPALAEAEICFAPASPAKAERFRPWLGRSNTVFYLNRAEAAALLRDPAVSTVDAARRLWNKGSALVVVTDGAGPVAVAGPEGLRTQSPPKVRARAVTGAGDTFLAAHIAARLDGADQTDALNTALGHAAAHVAGDNS